MNKHTIELFSACIGQQQDITRACSRLPVPEFCAVGVNKSTQRHLKVCYSSCQHDACNWSHRTLHHMFDLLKRRTDRGSAHWLLHANEETNIDIDTLMARPYWWQSTNCGDKLLPCLGDKLLWPSTFAAGGDRPEFFRQCGRDYNTARLHISCCCLTVPVAITSVMTTMHTATTGIMFLMFS